jgi:hypothetical protein
MAFKNILNPLADTIAIAEGWRGDLPVAGPFVSNLVPEFVTRFVT